MDSTVDTLIKNTVENYSRMLSNFRPCKPGSEFLEQNLITLLSHEFLKQNPTGIAYSELPFITPDGDGQWGSQLDAYLANNAEGFLVEAKGSQSKDELFKLIEKDLKRISSNALKNSFGEMATSGDRDRCYSIPSKISGLIIADCWYESHAEQWDMNQLLSSRFPLISKLSTKSYKVGEFGNFSYFILAGQTKALWQSNCL